MSAEALEPLTVVPVPGMGAEDVVVADDGTVYTGTEDGAIWAIHDGGGRLERVGRTPGRPLGLELLDGDRLLVCDAGAGLLTLDLRDGTLTTWATSADGRPLVFTNNAAVGRDGTVYFSDSSAHHSIERWKADMVQDTASGRLLRREPDGRITPLLEGLRFANGVALAPDESFVCVAQTAARDVVRRWLSGPRAGEVDLFVADLPGYPDNLARGSDGLIWVTITSPTDPVLSALQRAPGWVQQAVLAMPEALQPKPKRTARVQAYDADGRLVHDRRLAAHGFHTVTGVREHQGRCWLGSLFEPAVAWFEV